MELRHLRYFVVAAEEAHFGRAAERLHISGQGLGVQIRELERELGFELFERLPRGLQLTAAGAALLTGVRRVLGDLQTVIKQAEDVSQGKVGVLRVGHVPMSFTRGTAIESILPEFCVRYPTVDVRSIELNTAEQVTALQERRIDVGIAYTPPEATHGIRAELFVERALDGALLPATHSLTRKDPLYCRDLGVLPCLLPPIAANPSGRALLVREFRARGLEVHVDEEHEISDLAVRINLVAAGGGWIPMIADAVEMLLIGTRGIVFRKWADSPIRYPYCFLWRADDPSSLVANFLSFCRELRDRTVREPSNRRASA